MPPGPQSVSPCEAPPVEVRIETTEANRSFPTSVDGSVGLHCGAPAIRTLIREVTVAREIRILCVHGVAHGDADALLAPTWTDAITAGIRRWNPDLAVRADFLRYDDLFDHAPLNALVYGEALAKLMASGIIHGIGDWFAGTRGLEDVPDRVRWTAGMIAQWASEDDLRERLRARLLAAMQAK